MEIVKKTVYTFEVFVTKTVKELGHISVIANSEEEAKELADTHIKAGLSCVHDCEFLRYGPSSETLGKFVKAEEEELIFNPRTQKYERYKDWKNYDKYSENAV